MDLPARIIVFAKAPIAGRVKTRLLPMVGAKAAAQLHEAFVRDIVESLRQLTAIAEIELCTDIETKAWIDLPVRHTLQAEGDLGARMFDALSRALGSGCTKAAIVGADSPGLPPDYIRMLLASGADVALGPTDDGGYYAIACRRIPAAMFASVRWSTAWAMEDTIRSAESSGLTVELCARWFDVDRPEDLEKLAALKQLPRHTMDWLRANGRLHRNTGRG